MTTTTPTYVDIEAALRAFVAADPVAPVIPDEVAAQARELDDLRSAIKTLEKREKVLRASILEHLVTEGVDSLSDGEVSIARSTYLRTGIDKARMAALYPKVLADVSTETPVENLRVKIKG